MPDKGKDEKRFYPIVRRFLEQQGYTTKSWKKDGTVFEYTDRGRADVVGVKEVGKRHSMELSIVAVEVKDVKMKAGRVRTRASIRKLTQAFGHHRFADMCYLAMPREFDDSEIEEARRMGIGLLKIKKESDVTEVLSPQPRRSQPAVRMKILANSLRIVRCSVCGSYNHRWKDPKPIGYNVGSLGKKKRVYLCHSCVSDLPLRALRSLVEKVRMGT